VWISLAPKSPEFNGSVGERANRTHSEEFYEVYDMHRTVKNINPQLRKWEQVYNCLRPHQAFNDLTRLQYLQRLGIVTKTALPVPYVVIQYILLILLSDTNKIAPVSLFSTPLAIKFGYPKSIYSYKLIKKACQAHGDS
jgi:hypothetical protein